MHCPNCGIPIAIENSNFCHSCGQDLRGIPASSGDVVGGDKTSVGSIDNAKGVAIGEGNKVDVSETYIGRLSKVIKPISFGGFSLITINTIKVVSSCLVLFIGYSLISPSPNGPNLIQALRGIGEQIENFLEVSTPTPTSTVMILPVPPTRTIAATATPNVEGTQAARAATQVAQVTADAVTLEVQGTAIEATIEARVRATVQEVINGLAPEDAKATATVVPPTPVPEPDVSIEPEIINKGGCAKLTWSIQNVEAVFLNDEGVVGESEEIVCPKETGTYDYVWRIIAMDQSISEQKLKLIVNP